MSEELRKIRLESWAVFGALAALYWVSRCPSYGPGDSAQHALAAMTWGVPRAPGYPLYTALAHVFARLGGVSWVGGFSGLAQAGAAALLYLVCRRGGCGAPASLAAAALLWLSPLFWYYAEVPEVRGLNDLLAAAGAAAAVCGAPWTLLGLLLGLGLSHHPTFVLVVPSILLLARRPSRREAASAAAAAALGLAAPYALLWARLSWGAPPAYNADGVSGAAGMLSLWLRRGTGGFFSVAAGAAPGFSGAGVVRQLAWYARSAYASFTLGLLLAALGAWTLRQRRRELAAWLLWAALPAAVYALLAGSQLRLDDPEYLYAVSARFHLLPLMGLLPLAAYGAQWLARRTRERFVWGLAAAAVAGAALRPVSLRAHEPTRDYALDILGASRPGDVVVLGSDDAAFALLYEDVVEGRGGGRVWLVPAMLGYAPYRAALAARHPDLALPPGDDPARPDWRRWLALNPGRAFWAEGTLRAALQRDLPTAYPDGPLIRLSAAPGPASSQDGARRFLASSLGKLSRWQVYDFTQEVGLLRDGAALAHWHQTRNPSGDLTFALIERLESL